MIKAAQKEYIFSAGEVTRSCHASTVLPLKDGSVLAAWFGGDAEKDKNVEIYVAIRSPKGQWSKPRCVSEKDEIPCWNPVLYERKDGVIILFYKYGNEIAEWITKFVASADGGKHWSAPRELVPGDYSGGRGPVKNKCLRVTSRLLLAPASTEHKDLWLPFIDISEDDGETWTRTPLMERPDYNGAEVKLIQPTLWEDAEGSIHCFLRSNQGALYRCDSLNSGHDWGKPYRTNIPNNNSGIDCCTDDKNRLWLAYNPVGEDWGPRYPLCLACSKDNGRSFTDLMALEAEEGEYSYPAIVFMNGALHLTYTYKREQIVYWRIELE